MDVHKNIAALAAALAEIKNHPMCARFSESNNYYLVIFPTGFRVDGARASVSMGKLAACRRLLQVMEREWIAGGIQ